MTPDTLEVVVTTEQTIPVDLQEVLDSDDDIPKKVEWRLRELQPTFFIRI